jgi:hypothetical protein
MYVVDDGVDGVHKALHNIDFAEGELSIWRPGIGNQVLSSLTTMTEMGV